MTALSSIHPIEDFHDLMKELGWEYHIDYRRDPIPARVFGGPTTYLVGSSTAIVECSKDGVTIRIEDHDLLPAIASALSKVLRQ